MLLGTNWFLLWFNAGHSRDNIPFVAYQNLEQKISNMNMMELDVFLHEELSRAKGVNNVHIQRITPRQCILRGIAELGKFENAQTRQGFLQRVKQSLSIP